MKINASRFGELEVNPEAVLTFPKGLPGFEQCTRFQLLNEEGAGPVVFYLQSLDDADVAFSIVDPSQFGINYQLTLSDDEVALLKAAAPEQLAVALIVYRPDAGGTSDFLIRGGVAANINGPLVLNLANRTGLQKVLVGPQVDITLKDTAAA